MQFSNVGCRLQGRGIPDTETALRTLGLPSDLCQLSQKVQIARFLASADSGKSSLPVPIAKIFAVTFDAKETKGAIEKDLESYRLALLNVVRHTLRDVIGTELLKLLDSAALSNVWMPDYGDIGVDNSSKSLTLERITSSYEAVSSYVSLTVESSHGELRVDGQRLRSDVLHRLLEVLASSSQRRARGQTVESDDELDSTLLILLGRLLADSQTTEVLLDEDRSTVPVVMGFANAKSPKVTQSVSAVLARLLGSSQTGIINPGNPEVLRTMLETADRWLGGSEAEHITALRALTFIISGSFKDAQNVLLREGFLPVVVEYAEAHRETTAGKGQREQSAELEAATAGLIAAGSVDADVRRAVIGSPVLPLLLSIASTGPTPSPAGQEAKAQAISALIKLMFMPAEGFDIAEIKSQISSTISAAEMIKFLGSRIVESASVAAKKSATKAEIDQAVSLLQESLESLVYVTLQPLAKELVCRNAELIKAIVSLAQESGTPKSSLNETSMVHYGILGVVHNLSVYKPKLTDEEQQMQKLQAFAKKLNADSADSKFEDDEAVNKRCKTLISAGALDALAAIAVQRTKNVDSLPLNTAALLIHALANLISDQATAQKTRGLAVQRGFVPLLVRLAGMESVPTPVRLASAQCVARIAISINPEVAFKGGKVLDIIRPIVNNLLVSKEASGLHQFEALLALTNLASVEGELGEAVRDRIVTSGAMKEAEALQFSDTILLQRASTELFCNMVYEPSVFESFVGTDKENESDQGVGPTNRLKMMVALCSVDDIDTRRAASGTVAILSAISEDFCQSVCKVDRAMTYICGLVGNTEPPDLQHRGAEILKNCILAGGDSRKAVEKAGGVALLKALARRPDAIGEAAREGLAAVK